MTDKQAEDFVIKFAWYLLPEDVYINLTRPDGYVEGADWQSFSLFKGNGNIEVKRMNSFLTRGNDNNEATGTMYFELFQNNEIKRRNEWYGGWLLSETNPQDYTFMRRDIRTEQLKNNKHPREVKARTPGVLVWILTDERNAQTEYACVAFEKIPELITRLCELCPDPDKWGLTDPEKIVPATDRNYWKQYEIWNGKWNDQYGTIINNMWHVPFRQIIDLATVTMLGSKDPDTTKTITRTFGNNTQITTPELQQSRLNTLKTKAEERGTMARLIPEKVEEEERKILEKVSKDTGIPVDKLYPVNTDKLTDPVTLAKIKASYERARQRHKEITGEDLPTWEMRTTRPIKRMKGEADY